MAVTINGTTGVAVPLGTAGAPGVVNTTSATTGIYNPSSTSVAIATNGTLAVTVDATQGVTFAAKVIAPGQSYAAIAALTDGTTITPDFGTANNFSVTLAGNRTLANPTNLIAGQSGIIYVSQDATGNRTLAYGSYWKFPNAAAPTLTTTASATDALVYVVRNSTSITVNSILNIG